MIRKVSEGGRIAIPVELQRQLAIKEGDKLEFKRAGAYITLSKCDTTICEECRELVDKTDIFCKKCGKKLKNV